MRLRTIFLLGLTAAGLMLLSGCGNGMEADSVYSFEAREQVLAAAEAGSDRAEAFAARLCVVEDEGRFDSSEVDAEAAAVFSIDDQMVIYSKNAYEQLVSGQHHQGDDRPSSRSSTAIWPDEVTVTDDRRDHRGRRHPWQGSSPGDQADAWSSSCTGSCFRLRKRRGQRPSPSIWRAVWTPSPIG